MTDDERLTLGERIRRFRDIRGLTLGALAKVSGVNKGYLSQLERGERPNPSIEILTKLSRGLEIQVSELIGEEPLAPRSEEMIPEELQAFLDEAEEKGSSISPQEVEMLRGIHYRGRYPKSKEDWAFLLDVIKRTIH